MTLREELEGVLRRDGPIAAAALVDARAAAGDVAALEMLGHWRLWGLYGPRDPAAGYAAMASAATGGSEEAALTQAALLSTGTGVTADPAAARAIVAALAPRCALARQQIDLVSACPPTPLPRTLREEPYVARIDALLSADECAYVIDRLGAAVRPSLVIDPSSGRRMPNPVRDSHGANVAPPDEDIVLHAINRRIATATATDWAQGEPLHLLRYTPGQQYRPHLDALPGVANQRVLTVLIYLNDGYGGGETRFADGMTVRGGIGDAVIFANVRDDGSPDPRTEHAGLPVTHGTKWLATRWIRRGPHDPWSA